MEKNFKDLELSPEVLKAVTNLGYSTPTPIQEQMIPLILNGEDLIGEAQTGTGKTLAYASSILSKIDWNERGIKALILTPTRELAIQVEEEFISLGSHPNAILSVYGGSSIENQIRKLRKGVHIVAGTPGRVLDLIKRGSLQIDHLDVFVLDEADEMLNMGFLPDMEAIFGKTNENKQVLMLSATMPKEIKSLAVRYMKKDYQHIQIKSDSKTADHIDQFYYLVNEKVRTEVLCRLLDVKNAKRTIIFCATKNECDELLTDLLIRGYHAEVMHGDIVQEARIKTLNRFKKGTFKVLIATDVAARGIHVDNIECVINYKLPNDRESYIHRIGRTGRAGAKGEAISLVNQRNLSFLKDVEKFAHCVITAGTLPSPEELVQLKYNHILTQAKELIAEGTAEDAIPYVRDLNKNDLFMLAASLLKMTVDKEMGANLSKQVDVREPRNNSVQRGTTRVFINIGKKDGLKKGSLLDYLKDQTGIRKENFQNIEVLSTFTFIDVNDKVVENFMKKINNKKYKDRIVHIEKAKKQK